MAEDPSPGGGVAVRALAAPDAPRAVPCLVRAFWDYPETTHLLPDERRRRRVLPRYLGSDVIDSARFGSLFAATDAGERVVAAAAWLPPSGYPVGWPRQVREAVRLAPAAPWGVAALREAKRGSAANREHHRCQPPHYWLRAIGVDPALQGSGIGTALVRRGTDLADDERVGCFLFTATASNARWYETLGFEILAAYRPTPAWPDTWAMWRPARGGPV